MKCIGTAKESRRTLIGKGDAAVQTAISSANAKKEEAMLIDLRKDEQIVIELSDDSDDDFVVEVSKEEQLEAPKAIIMLHHHPVHQLLLI